MRTLLALGVLALGCGSPAQDAFEDRRVAILPAEGKARAFTFSRDGRVVAYVLDVAGKDHLVVGSSRGTPFDKM